MSNFAQRKATRTGSHGGLSSDWDVVSESAMSQEQYSTGSLTSEGSDAVIIFGGPRKNAASLSGASSPDSAAEEDEPWQAKHQRLLSAVSDLASDPGRHRVNADLYGGLQRSMPIEQRLLDQIAKLAEDLDESQEQAKMLLLQNDRLANENDALKKRTSRREPREGDEETDLARVTFAVAAGIVIIGLAKKKLLFNGVGFLSAAMFGGCVGMLRLLNRPDGAK